MYQIEEKRPLRYDEVVFKITAGINQQSVEILAWKKNGVYLESIGLDFDEINSSKPVIVKKALTRKALSFLKNLDHKNGLKASLNNLTDRVMYAVSQINNLANAYETFVDYRPVDGVVQIGGYRLNEDTEILLSFPI